MPNLLSFRFLLPFFVLLVSWTALIFLAPISVGWRDSGEFLISPFFLDIVHPAGFPTYTQVANIFALIPLGPIGWRVHLFSAFCGLLFIASTLWCTNVAVQSLSPASRLVKFGCAFVALAAVLHSHSFWKGILSAEVYLLNGAFILAGIAAFGAYLRSRDARILLSLGFFSGIACGNHIAFAVSALCMMPAIIASKVPLKSSQLAIVFGAVGLCVYGLLPVRALANPPLNTGDAKSFRGFVQQVTNARDSALRPKTEGSAQTSAPSFIITLGKDVIRLCKEVPLGSLGIALIGVLALTRANLPFLLGLTGPAIGTLLFFSGWDVDPWTPALAVAAVLAATGFAASCNLLRAVTPRLFGAWVCSIIFVCIVSPFWLQLPAIVSNGSSYEVPSRTGRKLLDTVEPNRLLITEPSWFILRYLTAIEGYRDDVALAYQPQLLFAGLFAPTRMLISSGITYSSAREVVSSSDRNVKAAAQLIDLASQSGVVYLESTSALTAPFRGLLQLRANSLPVLIKGESRTQSPDYVSTRQKFFLELQLHLPQGSPFFDSDAQNYLETLLAREVELLGDEDALILYRSVCTNGRDRCSARIMNNFGLALLNSGQQCEAYSLFKEISTGASASVLGTIRRNQQIAASQCQSAVR